jgi:VanZ family protein
MVLLHSWPSLGLRYSLRDIVVNVLLYMPLGFAAHLAFRKSAWTGLGIYGPVLLGLLLSTSMELLQLLEPARNTSMVDLLTNVIGSGLGVFLGLLFEAVPHTRGLELEVADRAALMLTFCWIAWLFFPLFPALTTHSLAFKVRAFTESSPFDVRGVISATASWYAAGLLLSAAGMPFSRRAARAAFAATLLAIPAQFLIVDKQPTESLLAGAIFGVVLFLVLHRAHSRKGVVRGYNSRLGARPLAIEAWAFLTVIVLRGLAPFHFSHDATPFGWTPLGATLDSEWQTGGAILLEKILYYGTGIWLLHSAGIGRARATMTVVVVLSAIEFVQIHLPGRTPESTDPLLALLLGVVLAGLMPVRRA